MVICSNSSFFLKKVSLLFSVLIFEIIFFSVLTCTHLFWLPSQTILHMRQFVRKILQSNLYQPYCSHSQPYTPIIKLFIPPKMSISWLVLCVYLNIYPDIDRDVVSLLKQMRLLPDVEAVGSKYFIFP